MTSGMNGGGEAISESEVIQRMRVFEDVII